MSQTKLLAKISSILILFSYLVVPFLSLPAISQAAPATQPQQLSLVNRLNLTFPFVIQNGKRVNVANDKSNLNFTFADVLNDNDQIRYSWKGVDLNLKYKNAPVRGGGYLKIFINDDLSATNLISEHGSSPLAVSKLNSKLKPGENKLLFVFTGNASLATKVTFSFFYKSKTAEVKPEAPTTPQTPTIKVIDPAVNTVFMGETEKLITLEIGNFELESVNSNQPNKGKLSVYFDKVDAKNKLGTLTASTPKENGLSEVKVSSKDFNFQKIPDNDATKLIFVLTNSQDQPVKDGQSEFPIKTNYNNQLNVGLPRITIIDPSKNSSDLTVDGNRRFSLKIENFEVLTERVSGPTENNKGYVQVFVNNTPIETVLKTQDGFTFNEIKLAADGEARKTVKVQLVNTNFQVLTPEASDSISVIYVNSDTENVAQNPQVQNNTWRILIIAVTVILIVGGIVILITKG